MCLYVFPPLLKEFRRRHPDVDIKVITGGTPRLVRKLRSGAADLGLLTLPTDDSALATVPVIRIDSGSYASADGLRHAVLES